MIAEFVIKNNKNSYYFFRLLNHVMKNGSSVANTLGVVCVMYSGIGVGLQLIRDTDDSINTMIAATCTGMLFKSTG